MDLASAEAEIRHVFGDTPITEASIGAAPPDILVELSGCDAGFVLSEPSLYPYSLVHSIQIQRHTDSRIEIIKE